MIIKVALDTVYLVLPKARSCIAGYFRLDNRLANKRQQYPNGVVLIECKTLRNIVSLAAEVKTCCIFHISKIVLPIRYIFISLHHPQPPTPIKTDNTTILGFS